MPPNNSANRALHIKYDKKIKRIQLEEIPKKFEKEILLELPIEHQLQKLKDRIINRAMYVKHAIKERRIKKGDLKDSILREEIPLKLPIKYSKIRA